MQAIGHGISTSVLDSLRDGAKEFFDLPMEIKEKYARLPDGIQGYGNDPILSENQVFDWSDRLILQLLPEQKRDPRFWPHHPSNFRYLLLSLRLLSFFCFFFCKVEVRIELNNYCTRKSSMGHHLTLNVSVLLFIKTIYIRRYWGGVVRIEPKTSWTRKSEMVL